MSNASSEFGNIFSLAGEHALITGGGTGLGLAMAQCFVAAGARVTMVGRRPQPLQAACRELGANAACLAADITDPVRVATCISEAENKNGPLTILVNNAGVHLKKPAAATTDAEFQSVIQTHLFAAFSLSREASKGMLERGHGSILFTASMTSFIGMTQVVAYSAAKSAYLGVVRALAAEWSGKGVRVNAIAPGWIQSEMLEKALAGDTARRAKIISRTPMGRMGEPHDIGWAAVYLCSPAAQFVTGVVLPIDGGASIGF
jgi:NAD(P)-dependent dehydrogenase (short-subunit alcohol dehydrogenase family)